MWKLYLVALALAARRTLRDTPAGKVITLLTDLKAQAQDELAAETKVFTAFLAFCKTKTTEKATAIDDNNVSIDTAQGGIDGAKASIATAQRNFEKNEAEKSSKTAELATKTRDHEAAKAELEKTELDLSKAVSSLQKAIDQIKAGTSLISQSVINHHLAVAEALGISSKAVSLLSNDPGDYESHSGDIVEVLENLLVEFKDKHSEVTSEISSQQKAFDENRAALEKAIAAATKASEAAVLKKNQEMENLGMLEEDLSNATIDLRNNEQYHADLTARCGTKKAEWEQRELGRQNEIKAIEGALTQLDTVGAKEVNRTAKAFVQAPKVEAKVEKVPTFLQTKRFLSPIANHVRAADFLLEKGKGLHSASLVSMSTKLTGPFDKVKRLIQRLIERLLDEGAQEANSQGKCATERAEAENNRNNRHAEIRRKHAEVSKLDAQMLELESTIDRLNTQIDDLRTSLKEAEEMRTEEKEANLKAIADATEGQKAVKEATRILHEYYHGVHGVGGADTARVLVQTGPVEEEAEYQAVAGRGGAYKGNQDSAGNIFGLLEVIQSDFQREIKTTRADEAQAHEDYVKQRREDTANLKGKSTQLEHAEGDLAITNSKIDLGLSDMQTAADRQAKAIEILDLLWSRCVAVDMSFAERKAKIQQEIDALKQVITILQPAP